jgi:hypothetical protein
LLPQATSYVRGTPQFPSVVSRIPISRGNRRDRPGVLHHFTNRSLAELRGETLPLLRHPRPTFPERTLLGLQSGRLGAGHLRFHLRGRGLRQLHRAAEIPGRAPASVRTAGRVLLRGHAVCGHQGPLRGCSQKAGAGQAAVAGPVRGHGSKGQRWYAWAWIGTASPRHHLLIRCHLTTGELAFHHCYVPKGTY